MVFAIIIGTVSGVTVVLNRMFNASLGEQTDHYRSTFYNYLIGFIGSCILMLCVQRSLPAFVAPQTVWHIIGYSGAAFGVAAVLITSKVSLKLPVFLMTMLMFLSQLSASIVLDYFIDGSLSVGKLVGGGILGIGLFVYQMPIHPPKNAESH